MPVRGPAGAARAARLAAPPEAAAGSAAGRAAAGPPPTEINMLGPQPIRGCLLVSINPLDAVMWALRRSERDVINLYDALAPIMRLATGGGTMLNFGYWDGASTDPLSAQRNLCLHFAGMADLGGARKAVDAGSGLAAPALLWKDAFGGLSIYCVNTSYAQLRRSGRRRGVEFVNSSATRLPFADGSVDRVLALESAQHFRPLEGFVSESRRVLCGGGLLVLAIPVTVGAPSISRLGILRFAWMSEHHSLARIRGLVRDGGFLIEEERLIGSSVYEPLADYYVRNRASITESLAGEYPRYVEAVLHRSIRKMGQASRDKAIEYLLLKCSPRRGRAAA